MDGSILKKLIKEARMTQGEFADKMGLALSTVTTWIKQGEIAQEHKEKIAKVLGVDVKVFEMSGKNPDTDLIPVTKREYEAMIDLIKTQRELIDELKRKQGL